MYKKLVLALGAAAVIISLAMPVTDILPPSSDGSIIFTWTAADKQSHTDWPATASRTLALASGALLVAVVLPERRQ